MSSKAKNQREFERRYAHIGADAARKAGRLWDGSGAGGTILDGIERPTQHPDYSKGKTPVSSWDNPTESNRREEGIVHKEIFTKEQP